MRLYFKINPASFHLDPIQKDGALGFFEGYHLNNKKNNKMGSNMRSVPHPKRKLSCCILRLY